MLTSGSIKVSTETAGYIHQERMRDFCNEQLNVLNKVDGGYPDWKGDILKHLSTASLNLARMDLEAGRIERPAFLARVREAMHLVQEGVRCKSCVKVDRSSRIAMRMSLDEMVDSMSESESESNSLSSSVTDLR